MGNVVKQVQDKRLQGKQQYMLVYLTLLLVLR
jgi:hypothetical protein